MRKYLLIPLCLLMSGCGLFKEARRDIPPPPPRLDYKEGEAIKQVAEVNHQLAKWIRENGVKPGDEKAILLEDGTRVILKYVGQPYTEVDAKDVKKSKKIIEKGEDVATDFQRENARFDDKLDKNREKIIEQTNLKWAWGRIVGFLFSSWFLAGVGLVVAAIFFPVLLPVLKLFWQLSKAGFGAFKIIASFGVTGLTSLVKSTETFREKFKGTETGKEFDAHMSRHLPEKTKSSLDSFKNHFDI